jgi:hypothetical protein
MKLLTKVYQSHINSPIIITRLALITGEYIRFNNKKYPIFAISIKGDYRDKSYEKSIEEIGIKSNCTIHFEHDETLIHAALVS